MKINKKMFSKWMLENYGIQDMKNYAGTQTEEICVRFAQQQVNKISKASVPSLPLSELKKILWGARLTKRQARENDKNDMKFDYNQGWTNAINKIITKIKWR